MNVDKCLWVKEKPDWRKKNNTHVEKVTQVVVYINCFKIYHILLHV